MTHRTDQHEKKPLANRRRARAAPRLPRLARGVLGVVLGSFVAVPVLHVMGCGARSELLSPGEAAAGCTEMQSSVYSASIGGGIHHIFTECMPRPDGGVCPPKEDAVTELQPANCPIIDEAECGPIVKPEECCYVVEETCGFT